MTGTFTLNTLERGFWISFYAIAINFYLHPLPILIPGKDITKLRGKVHISHQFFLCQEAVLFFALFCLFVVCFFLGGGQHIIENSTELIQFWVKFVSAAVFLAYLNLNSSDFFRLVSLYLFSCLQTTATIHCYSEYSSM